MISPFRCASVEMTLEFVWIQKREYKEEMQESGSRIIILDFER